MKTCWILVLLCVMQDRLHSCPALRCDSRGRTERRHGKSNRPLPCERFPAWTTQRTCPVPTAAAAPRSRRRATASSTSFAPARSATIIHPRRAILLWLGGDVAIRLAGNELILRTGGAVKRDSLRRDLHDLRSEQEKKEKEREQEWEREQPSLVAITRPGCYTESGIEISCGGEEALPLVQETWSCGGNAEPCRRRLRRRRNDYSVMQKGADFSAPAHGLLAYSDHHHFLVLAEDLAHRIADFADRRICSPRLPR